MRAFRAASLKGWEYAVQHPEEIAELTCARYSQRHSMAHLLFEAEHMKPLLQLVLVEPGHMNPGRWRHIAEVYTELGMMKPGFDLAGFLYDPNPPQSNLTHLYLVLATILLAILIIGGVALHIHHRINQRLAASEKRYHAIFNNAPLSFIVSDNQQIILDWNQAAQDMFGWKKAETLGRNLYELLVPPAELPQVMRIVGTTLHGGTPTHSKNHDITRDGNILCCEWRNAQFFDAKGNIQGIISRGMDITERASSGEKPWRWTSTASMSC